MATTQVRRHNRALKSAAPMASTKSNKAPLLLCWLLALLVTGATVWFLLSSHLEKRSDISVAPTLAAQPEFLFPAIAAEEAPQLEAMPPSTDPQTVVVLVAAPVSAQLAGRQKDDSSATPLTEGSSVDLEEFIKPFNERIRTLEELCSRTRTSAFIAAENEQVAQQKYELQAWLKELVGQELTIRVRLRRKNFGKILIFFPEETQLVFAIKGPFRESMSQSSISFIPIHNSRTKLAADQYWNTVLEDHHYPKGAFRQHKDEESLRRLTGYSEHTFEGILQARVTGAQLGNGGEWVDDYLAILDLDDVQLIEVEASQPKEEPKVATRAQNEKEISRKRFTGF